MSFLDQVRSPEASFYRAFIGKMGMEAPIPNCVFADTKITRATGIVQHPALTTLVFSRSDVREKEGLPRLIEAWIECNPDLYQGIYCVCVSCGERVDPTHEVPYVRKITCFNEDNPDSSSVPVCWVEFSDATGTLGNFERSPQIVSFDRWVDIARHMNAQLCAAWEAGKEAAFAEAARSDSVADFEITPHMQRLAAAGEKHLLEP